MKNLINCNIEVITTVIVTKNLMNCDIKMVIMIMKITIIELSKWQ